MRFIPLRFIPSALLLTLIHLAGGVTELRAEQVMVAVASNFTAPMQEIEQAFEATTPHELTLVIGSSGKIYAQIQHGAPYDVFLSADQDKPQRLEDKGLAVKGSRFTYAQGTLALWHYGNENPHTLLMENRYQHIAVANPKLAPYGLAAKETLEALGLANQAQSKQVTGENITQAWQFTASGNAELGLVALSQLVSNTENKHKKGQFWLVPQSLYSPVYQDAVLLTDASDNPAAKAFMRFLKSDKAREIMEGYGYGVLKMEDK